MQSERPGMTPGVEQQSAKATKTVAERLLSYLGPRTVFITVGGGILVSAALVLTLVAGSGGKGPIVKALQSFAGFTNTTSTGSSWYQTTSIKCPADQRLDAIGRCTPFPRPPVYQNLKLNVTISPAVVTQGGSYTLSASYIDQAGTAQKYTGYLNYQLRLCDLSDQNCQTSSGPWGDYKLSEGSVDVSLPLSIGTGIYHASFMPRDQKGWDWSSEATVTVNPANTPPPPAPTACSSQGITAVGASASASLPSAPATFAIDGRTDTMWNSGGGAPQYITLDLGASYNINKLCLFVTMTPDGQVNHLVQVGQTPDGVSTVATVNKTLHNGQWEEVALNATGRYVRIYTQQTPSWVAWAEIKAFGTQDNNTPPPPPTGCLTGSVVLTSSNIVVGTTTTVRSTLSGIAVTYDSDDHNIATVNGTTVTAGSTAGSTSVTGHFVYAGRSCDLTPATLTVTGGNVAGSVSTSGTNIYLCTSNGTSNSVTVTVAVTRGSGKVDVNGGVSFSGPTRLDAPNSWIQTISPGNFIGLNGSPNGQASVTISLKDYFTGALVDSKTVTATINPPSNCPQPGQSSLTVGTVYAACSSSLSATADSISATSATASTSRVVGNSRSLLSLDPNGSASQTNVSIGYATDGNVISFSLIEDGSNRVLAGPVTKTVQANPACSPTGTITPNTSYVSTCALNGRPSSVTLSAAITTSFGEGDIVVGSGSYPGGPFGHVVAGGGAKTFTISAGQMDVYSGVTFNIRTSGGNLVSGAGAVVYRDDRSCAQSPTGTLSVSPATLALCSGDTGTFNITVSGANYGGMVTKGGQFFATFTAPGGSWSDTVSSSMIGQTITYSGQVNPGFSAPVGLNSVNVQVTQKSNCAPAQGSVSTSPMTLFIPDNQTCTYTVYGSANVAAYLKLGGVTLQYLTPNSPASSTLSTSNQNGTWNFSVVDQATGQQLASTYFSTARSSGSVCGMP